MKNAIRCTMSIYGLEVGGTAGKHGVGVLLHNRWSNYVHRQRAISPRLGVLDLNVQQLKISMVVVYIPHCGSGDEHVEEMYAQLSLIIQEARSRKRIVMASADWNAEVESMGPDREKHDVVGHYANAIWNSCGEWLKRWAMAERMTIAKTMLKKRWVLRWTHNQQGR